MQIVIVRSILVVMLFTENHNHNMLLNDDRDDDNVKHYFKEFLVDQKVDRPAQ